MSAVSGVLLDHVVVHPAQRHLPPTVTDVDGVEWKLGDCVAGTLALSDERVECLLCRSGIELIDTTGTFTATGGSLTAAADLATDADVRILRGTVDFTYDGGCTTVRADVSGAGADRRGADIVDALGFVSRADLDRQIRAASDGHLHLDA